MSTAENKELLQRIFDGLDQGNSRPLVDAMDDDFTWTVSGTTKWSRRYEGKRAVLDQLFAALRERIDGRIRNTAHRFIAEGDYVVVEARGQNRTRDGKPYENQYCFVFRLGDGKLQEVTEYMDTLLVATVLGDESEGGRGR